MEPDYGNPIPDRTPRKKTKLLVIVGALLLVIVIAAILSINKPGTKPGQQSSGVQNQAQIEITKDGFVPATLTVPKGTKVTWVNKDNKPHRVASNPHPEHTGLNGLDSKEVIGINDGTYSFSFDKPGEYNYHDHLNPTSNGTVVVKD